MFDMNLLPLKTPEELYEIYSKICDTCQHLETEHGLSFVGIPSQAEQICSTCLKKTDIFKSNNWMCAVFVPLAPWKIAEQIEEYYETYEEHKRNYERSRRV